MALSQYASKNGRKKKHTQRFSVLQLLQTFLSMLYGKGGNVLLQTLKKKSQQKTLWEAGVKAAPVILLWQSKRWGNTERLDGAQIDESHTHTTQHHRATPDGTHQLSTFHKLFSPGVNTSSCWHTTFSFQFLNYRMSHNNDVVIRR